MAPVTRGTQKKAAPSRRAAPAQQRRTAAVAPTKTRRQAAEVEDETAFDAATDDQDDEEEEDEDEDDLPEVIDLSDVQAATYEVIPRGTYDGYIDSVEYGLSQSSNAPMLTFMVKLDYEDKERTLRYYATLKGEAAGRSKALLAKLDPELDFETFRPGDADEVFGGMDVKVRVTIRPDRDDRKIKRNNIADMSPLEEDE